jgi:hypothetical protein
MLFDINEGSGPNVEDLSGEGRHGSISGATWDVCTGSCSDLPFCGD